MKKIQPLATFYLLCSEGFDPQTLIVTPRLYSLVPIGTLKIADVIASPQPGYINSYSSVKQILRLPTSTKETSPARIGISCNEFVVLEFSSEGLYHGHVRQWKKLHPDMQEALIRRGMATRQGRIIEDA